MALSWKPNIPDPCVFAGIIISFCMTNVKSYRQLQNSSDPDEVIFSVPTYCISVLVYRGQGSVGAEKSVAHILIALDGLRNSHDHMITRHLPPSYCLYLVFHSLVSHSCTMGDTDERKPKSTHIQSSYKLASGLWIPSCSCTHQSIYTVWPRSVDLLNWARNEGL